MGSENGTGQTMGALGPRETSGFNNGSVKLGLMAQPACDARPALAEGSFLAPRSSGMLTFQKGNEDSSCDACHHNLRYVLCALILSFKTKLSHSLFYSLQ